MTRPAALITGLAGTELTDGERAFLREVQPWGLILFARNVVHPDQVAALVASARDVLGRNAPVLIDQEGGRVARLRPPHWLGWPTVRATVAGLPPDAAEAALRLRFRLIAHELTLLGIDVDCMPLLDLPAPGAHPVIGERAFGSDPAEAARFGRAVCEALRAGAVLPVIKHLPGHGRAAGDTHHVLPRVSTPLAELEATDFAAFRPLADEALGMTAHIVYEAIDPEAPATLSPAVIRAIRETIGFDGCLMTDDLSMQALAGPMGERAARSLAAGCDLVLHCNGDMGEMEAVAAATPALDGRAAERAERALASRRAPEPFDPEAAVRQYRRLMGEAAGV